MLYITNKVNSILVITMNIILFIVNTHKNSFAGRYVLKSII